MWRCQFLFWWLTDISCPINKYALQCTHPHLCAQYKALGNLAVLRSPGYNMQYSNALAPNKGSRRESTVESRESDPHSEAVASSPAARWLLAPCKEHRKLPDLSLCFLPALRSCSASCPTCRCRCQCQLVFSQRFDRKCQDLSPWIVHAFRSYDCRRDASAMGRLVRTHRVTRRTAVYQHSSLIKEAEARRIFLASKCFHFYNDKAKHSLSYWATQSTGCTATANAARFLPSSSSVSTLFEVKQWEGESIYHHQL